MITKINKMKRSLFTRISELITDPRRIVAFLGSRGFLNWMPDALYLKIVFPMFTGYKLDLKNPQTFNEKLQWLKLYDRNPAYIQMVDKYAVREYIANKIGDEYLIPLLGVWDRFEDIDFFRLPDQFVLKPTHDSGSVIICKDKAKLDIPAARKKISRSLRRNYYYVGREWPYKNVEPRIIAEKYIVDESGYELKDYKFFCFDGVSRAMFVASDRQVRGEEVKFDFYDMNFEHLPFTQGHPNSNRQIRPPVSFEKMKKLAGILSKGISQVRVDFYDINGQIYFGELTFSHFGGCVPFVPKEWDVIFGDWINIPDNTKWQANSR